MRAKALAHRSEGLKSIKQVISDVQRTPGTYVLTVTCLLSGVGLSETSCRMLRIDYSLICSANSIKFWWLCHSHRN